MDAKTIEDTVRVQQAAHRLREHFQRMRPMLPLNVGTSCGAVVATAWPEPGFDGPQADTCAYYGGIPLFESCPRIFAEFIVDLMNNVPGILNHLCNSMPLPLPADAKD
jgi:hypothetical protein